MMLQTIKDCGASDQFDFFLFCKAVFILVDRFGVMFSKVGRNGLPVTGDYGRNMSDQSYVVYAGREGKIDCGWAQKFVGFI